MKWKETAWVWQWAFRKVPALWYVRPRVIDLTDERVVVEIPFSRRTRNHVGSIYFGVLCVGADCAGGLIAMRRIRDTGNRVSLLFKDFHADFLKRAEGPVHFTCADGVQIGELVQKALETGQRQNMPVRVVATVPRIGEDPVAQFLLTLSLKRRSRSS